MDVEHLKSARQKRGLNQADVAALIGQSQTEYSRYERGIHEPGNENLCRLSVALNVSSDYLLGLDSNDGALFAGTPLSHEEITLLKAFRNCPLDMQRVVIATAQAAASSASIGEPGNRDAAEANTA